MRTISELIGDQRSKALLPKRVVTAAFLAPLAAPLGGVALAIVTILHGTNLDLTPPAMFVALWGAAGFVFGYLPCVLLGLPVAMILDRWEALTARNCLLISLTLGLAAPTVIAAWLLRPSVVGLVTIDAAVVMTCLAIAIAFCMLAGLPLHRRRDPSPVS